MASFGARFILDELHRRNLRAITNFKSVREELSAGQWNWKMGPETWSIAQVVDHLLITNNHYIDRLIEAIEAAPKKSIEVFKSGWVGAAIVRRLEPGSIKGQKRVKAPGFLEPQDSELDGPMMAESFLAQLDYLDRIIVSSRDVDFSSIKIPLSFTKLLKLNIGDVLRLIIAHNDRHLLQMQRLKDQVINHSK